MRARVTQGRSLLHEQTVGNCKTTVTMPLVNLYIDYWYINPLETVSDGVADENSDRSSAVSHKRFPIVLWTVVSIERQHTAYMAGFTPELCGGHYSEK